MMDDAERKAQFTHAFEHLMHEMEGLAEIPFDDLEQRRSIWMAIRSRLAAIEELYPPSLEPLSGAGS